MAMKLSSAMLPMPKETTFHVYVNGECVKANLNQEELDKELRYLHSFVELTGHENDAKIEYEECQAPPYAEASF